MQKTHTHFEQVPIEVAEKVLERENLPAERDDDHELIIENPACVPIEPQALSRKSGVSAA